MNDIPKTIFCDIDGCIFKHSGSLSDVFTDPIVLNGVKSKIQEWHIKGYYIILTTSRLPSMKKITEQQLANAKIPYHQLIIGISRGQRIIINDAKPDNPSTTLAITIERDRGIGDIDI